MRQIIDSYKDVVIQIATPYSTGTGFYIKQAGVIVTNEHVVRDNKQVIIEGSRIKKQLAKVIFIDVLYDIAFLEAPTNEAIPNINYSDSIIVNAGVEIIAIGHPFGLKFSATRGIISNAQYLQHDIPYIQHDAALNPGNSGGPLIDTEGRLIGINTFIIKDGNSIGFSLPIHYVTKTISEFIAAGKNTSIRCASCKNIISKNTIDNGYCLHCGTKAQLPTDVEPYEAVGIPKTIENMLDTLQYDVALSRRGPNIWEVQQGSARINIAYHEKTGLITGDAYLCTLPQTNIKPIYEYLLQQNYHTQGLTFSIKGQDIILSLLIYDRYFNEDTGAQLFQYLFQKADDYDNILVEQYGAAWKQETM